MRVALLEGRVGVYFSIDTLNARRRKNAAFLSTFKTLHKKMLSSKCALSFRDVASPNATLESRVSPSKRTRTVPRSSFLAFSSRFDDDDDDDDEVLRRQSEKTVTLRRRPRRRRRRPRRLRAGMSSAMMMIHRPPLVSANDALGIWAVVLASAHFGAWAEKKPWGAALGGACLIAALTTLILANLGNSRKSLRVVFFFRFFSTTRSSFMECTRGLNRERGTRRSLASFGVLTGPM